MTRFGKHGAKSKQEEAEKKTLSGLPKVGGFLPVIFPTGEALCVWKFALIHAKKGTDMETLEMMREELVRRVEALHRAMEELRSAQEEMLAVDMKVQAKRNELDRWSDAVDEQVNALVNRGR